MRLSNREKSGFFNFIGTFVLVSFVFGLVFYFLNIKLEILGYSSILLIIIPSILLIIFYYRGRQIFEYDSDGEALNFKNRNVFPILGKTASDEFPKYKLKNFEIINFIIFKKLFITIKSKKTNAVTLKYDISYLSKKELNDLKFSLTRVLKANKEKTKETNGIID